MRPEKRAFLAAVFGVRLSEVDEMIQNRFGKVRSPCCEEERPRPRELLVEG